MKRLPSLPFLIVLCLIAPLLFAQKTGNQGQNQNQTQNGNNQNNNAGQATPTAILMWHCSLPGGTYAVALRSIVSISSQEYLVDGHTRVTEVDIDTTGCALARFYYLEPNTPTNTPLGIGAGSIDKAQQLLQQGADATNQDVWQKVVKNYPVTTHAKTIEYRVQSKDTLTALYTSAETALRMNQNITFKGE